VVWSRDAEFTERSGAAHSEAPRVLSPSIKLRADSACRADGTRVFFLKCLLGVRRRR
jgi:hypothetical protein